MIKKIVPARQAPVELRARHADVLYRRLQHRLWTLYSTRAFTNDLKLGHAYAAPIDRRCLRLTASLLSVMAPRHGVIIAADFPGRAFLQAAIAMGPEPLGWTPLFFTSKELAGPCFCKSSYALVFAAVVNTGSSLVDAARTARREGLIIDRAFSLVTAGAEGGGFVRDQLLHMKVPYSTLLTGEGKRTDETCIAAHPLR